MSRSILAGIFVLVLSASNFAFAGAAESTTSATKSPASAAQNATSANETAKSVAETAKSAAVIASPDDTATATVTSDSTPAGSVAVGETTDSTSSADTEDAAAPAAGAYLVIGNAAAPESPAAAPPVSAESAPHVNRLRRLASGIASRTSAIASSLTRSAMRFIGTPYVFGGTRPNGFDCSGYVQHVFALLGVHLPRTADAQFDAGHKIHTAMVPGDLVFFHTYAPGVSHVGIYLGKNRFIHSASTHGVSISSLHDSYWAPRYLGAKRVFGS